MQSIVIVDYGMGNVHSVARALRHVAEGAEVSISNDPNAILRADRLVLPGQGSLPDCMATLERSKLKSALLEALQEKPVLGVCVGMQMLFSGSEERNSKGLGLLDGTFVKFDPQLSAAPLKVPHMGWNTVRCQPAYQETIFADIAPQSHFYFVHSYYLPLSPDSERVALATSDYGVTFVSAIIDKNIMATQFHPEKSGTVGLQLYRNFCHWQPRDT